MHKPFALALALAFLGAASSLALAEEARPSISITGSGEVASAPDMATVSISVTNEGATAREALSANSDNMAAVMERLKAAGIEERLIQTSGLNVSPRWDNGRNEGRPPRITGYVASNRVTVTVEELEKLGRILDEAVTDGANGLGGISFGLKDPEPVLNEARRKSVADAVAQAKLYAEAAGVRLGRITSIQPHGSQRPGPIMMARAMEQGFADSVPVSGGEVSTRSDVTITWELAQPRDRGERKGQHDRPGHPGNGRGGPDPHHDRPE